MAIKDLAVAFNGSDNAKIAVSFAIQMCRKYGAALTGLYAHMPFRYRGAAANWIPRDVVATIHETDRRVAGEIEATFFATVSEQGFDGETAWAAEEGQPDELLARSARYYDLLVMGQYSDPDRKRRNLPAENLVVRAGKPIVVVPNGYRVRPFREQAVVAWDGSRPAARALTDAMQILETKNRLDVLTVNADGAGHELPGHHDIVRHLRRHGVDAHMNVLAASRDGIGAAIVAFCEDRDTDVLVMGAFGHARLREELFGGVTRHILRASGVPVLLSH